MLTDLAAASCWVSSVCTLCRCMARFFFHPPDIMWLSSLCLAGFVFPGLPSNSASEVLIRHGTAPNAGTPGIPRGKPQAAKTSTSVIGDRCTPTHGCRGEERGGGGSRCQRTCFAHTWRMSPLPPPACHFDCALHAGSALPQVQASLRLLPAV